MDKDTIKIVERLLREYNNGVTDPVFLQREEGFLYFKMVTIRDRLPILVRVEEENYTTNHQYSHWVDLVTKFEGEE